MSGTSFMSVTGRLQLFLWQAQLAGKDAGASLRSLGITDIRTQGKVQLLLGEGSVRVERAIKGGQRIEAAGGLLVDPARDEEMKRILVLDRRMADRRSGGPSSPLETLDLRLRNTKPLPVIGEPIFVRGTDLAKGEPIPPILLVDGFKRRDIGEIVDLWRRGVSEARRNLTPSPFKIHEHTLANTGLRFSFTPGGQMELTYNGRKIMEAVA